MKTLERLKELCKQATIPQWVFKDNMVWIPDVRGNYEHDDVKICHGVNGKFVAMSRQAIPLLIDLVEAQEMEIESLRDVLDHHEIPIPGCPLHDEVPQARANLESLEV